jgi:cytochrome c-type biogenesis protein CcmH/NrfF
VASRSGGIRDVVFREDAGSSSEQLASVTPENKIYAHCDVVYDENFIAQIFQAMRMLHCKNQSIKDSSKENDAHLGGEKP